MLWGKDTERRWGKENKVMGSSQRTPDGHAGVVHHQISTAGRGGKRGENCDEPQGKGKNQTTFGRAIRTEHLQILQGRHGCEGGMQSRSELGAEAPPTKDRGRGKGDRRRAIP